MIKDHHKKQSTTKDNHLARLDTWLVTCVAGLPTSKATQAETLIIENCIIES